MFRRDFGAARFVDTVSEMGLGIRKFGLTWINLGERCAAMIPQR